MTKKKDGHDMSGCSMRISRLELYAKAHHYYFKPS